MFRCAIIAVLAAACSFDPSATRGSPGAGPDASPELDAAAEALPVLLETLQVPTTGRPVALSMTVLESGVAYTLRASGVTQDADDDAWFGDAEYYWHEDVPAIPGDSLGQVDVGLAIDDQQIDDDRTPSWGAYDQATHTYEATFTGKGSVISAQFHDVDGDNLGALTLEIVGPPPP